MITFFSLLGALLALLGGVGANSRFLSPIFGFYITGVGVILMGLLTFPAAVSFIRFGLKGAPWISLALGCASLGILGYLVQEGSKHPINDITTNPQSPPTFRGRVFSVPVKNAKNFLSDKYALAREYDSSFPAIQANKYPRLKPFTVEAPRPEVFRAVLGVIHSQFADWEITFEDSDAFHIELAQESKFFRFKDDVVIELRPKAENEMHTQLEIRSRSRVGKSDLGANFKRIEELSSRILEATQNVVASWKSRSGEGAQ